jgi:hypothetical protein
MKSQYLIPLVGLLSLPLLQAEELCSIQVKSVAVREKANYLAKISGTLEYAQQVNKDEQKDNWVKVHQDKVSGWIPATALSAPNVKFELPEEKKTDKPKAFGLGNMFSKKTEVSNEEVAMAGKAWSDDIPLNAGEGDYMLVDEMEKRKMDMEAVLKYLKSLQEEAAK